MMRLWIPVRWLVPFLIGVAVGAGGLFLLRPTTTWGWPLNSLSRRIEATIYLPTQNNNKQPYSDAEWHGALRMLVTEFGGATIGPPMEGYWSAKGRLLCEPVRPVIVSFEPERLKRFRQLVREMGRQLGQESIYTRFEEPHVELADMSNEV